MAHPQPVFRSRFGRPVGSGTRVWPQRGPEIRPAHRFDKRAADDRIVAEGCVALVVTESATACKPKRRAWPTDSTQRSSAPATPRTGRRTSGCGSSVCRCWRSSSVILTDAIPSDRDGQATVSRTPGTCSDAASAPRPHTDRGEPATARRSITRSANGWSACPPRAGWNRRFLSSQRLVTARPPVPVWAADRRLAGSTTGTDAGVRADVMPPFFSETPVPTVHQQAAGRE